MAHLLRTVRIQMYKDLGRGALMLVTTGGVWVGVAGGVAGGERWVWRPVSAVLSDDRARLLSFFR